MREPLREMLLDGIATTRDELGAFFRVAELEKLADEHRDRKGDYGHLLFTILFFTLWLQHINCAWTFNGKRLD